jgi:hypothetical protein
VFKGVDDDEIVDVVCREDAVRLVIKKRGR